MRELASAFRVVESKAIRRVRTPAGVRRYQQPIGSIIIRDVPMSNLTLGTPRYEGWDMVRGRDGNDYEIGQNDDGNWIVTTGNTWDPVITADTEEAAYRALDSHVGGSTSRGSGRSPQEAADDAVQAARQAQGHTNLTPMEPEWADWDGFRGTDGREYFVGRMGRNWVVTDRDSNVLMRNASRDELMGALDRFAVPRETANQPAADPIAEAEEFLERRRREREERIRASQGPESVTGADGNQISPGDIVFLGQAHSGGYGRSYWRVERTWPDGSVSISSDSARTSGPRGQVRNVRPDRIRLVNASGNSNPNTDETRRTEVAVNRNLRDGNSSTSSSTTEPNPIEEARELVRGEDAQAAQRALDNLNRTQLRDLATQMDLAFNRSDSASSLRHTILHFGMQIRLNSRAILRGNNRTRPTETPNNSGPLSMDITDDSSGNIRVNGESIPVRNENGRWYASGIPDGSGEISARNPQELVSRVSQRLGLSGTMHISDQREDTGTHRRPNLGGTVEVPAGEASMVLGGRTYTAQQMLDYARTSPDSFIRDWVALQYPDRTGRQQFHRNNFDRIEANLRTGVWTNEQAAHELRQWARLQTTIERGNYLVAANILDGSARPRNTRAHRQDDLEVKDRVAEYIKAVRRVRTASGERRYSQPIGSIIVRDGANPLQNLRVGRTNREVEGTDGTTYRIRQRNGQWEAESNGNSVVSAGTEEQLLEDLDGHVGSRGSSGSGSPTGSTVPPPRGSLQGESLTRSQGDDGPHGEAHTASDGTIYYIAQDGNEYVARDSNGNEIGRQPDRDAALEEATRFATANSNTDQSSRNSTSTPGTADQSQAPSAPPVGPVMPDSEQARAEIRAHLENQPPEALRNAARQAGLDASNANGAELLDLAFRAMIFLMLGVPLPRQLSQKKSASLWTETKADGEGHTGAMIALIPNAEDAQRLADESGEAWEELHVTLAYLGKAADISENAKLNLSTVASTIANNVNVVEVNTFSVNIFNPTGEEPCVVLGVGGRQLESIHAAVDSMCKSIEDMESGFTFPEQHKPFVPHITLKYFKDEEIDMDWVKTQFKKIGPIKFDKVRVAFAGRNIDMPLIGKDTMGDVPVEFKAPVITPGGRRGNDRSTGSRSNRENWVERSKPGTLPRYIRIVRNGLMREGHPESRATALAVAAIKRWARGGDNVTPKVQAAAAKALAEWEAMKSQKVDDRIGLFLKAGTIQDVDRRGAGATHIANRIEEGARSAVAAAQRAGRGTSGGSGKKRRVRSRAGEQRYGKPIGSEIGEADIKRKERADNLPDSVKKKLPMEFGQQGAQIQRIQKMLAEAGFPIETDGIFGKKTQAAIAEAQKQLGLKQTGVIDAITYVAIMDAARTTRGNSGRNRRRRQHRADD